MMLKVILLLVTSLSVAHAYCSLSFYANNRRGSNVFTFDEGHNATITMRCYGSSSSRERYDVYWASNNVKYIDYGVRVYRLYWEAYRFYRLSKYYNVVDGVKITGSGEYTSTAIIQFDFDSMNTTFNGSRIGLVDAYFGYRVLGSQEIIVTCCKTSELPSFIAPVGTHDNTACMADVQVDCTSGSLFRNSLTYLPFVTLTCSSSSKWENTSNVQCLPSCQEPILARPLYLYDYVQPITPAGTTSRIRCRSGQMYRTTDPKYFVSGWPTIECKADGGWNDPEVACWTGLVMDFTIKQRQFISGFQVLLYCKANHEGNGVKVELGKEFFIAENVVFENITMTSQHNGVVASCIELERSGNVIKKSETKLNVLYSPALISKDLNYALETGNSGEIVIKFQANPVISQGSIHVFKNGTSLSNYYLMVDGNLHSVVLHFVKVEAEDFGNYKLIVQTSTFGLSPLTANFSISESVTTSPNAFKSGDIAAIALSGVLTIALITFALTMAYKKLNGEEKRKRKSVNPNETMVTYEPETHNYEDIDGNSGENNLERAHSGYENMHIGQVQPNAYHMQDQRSEQRTKQLPLKPPPYEVENRYS
ncbi:uncharacterized protein LOC120346031 [Styela clava]